MRLLILSFIFFLSITVDAQLKKVIIDQAAKINPSDIQIQTVREGSTEEKPAIQSIVFKESPFPTLYNYTGDLRPAMIRDRNVPIYIEGQLKSTGTRGNDIHNLALEYLEAAAPLMKIKDPLHEFTITSVDNDELGYTHVKARQLVQGVPVYGSEVLMHAKNQKFDYLNGTYQASISDINTIPTVSLDNANQIILREQKEKPKYGENVKMLFKNMKDQSELVVYPRGGKNYLAYHIITYKNIIDRWEYFIDAHTGDIIHKYQSICKFHHHAPTQSCDIGLTSADDEILDGKATANAQDLFNISRSLNTYQVGTNYYLIDGARDIFASTPSQMPNDPNGVIWTIDAFNTSPSKDNFDYDHVKSTNNIWTNKTAVSAHYNGGQSFEYFRNTHGRKSINGLGGNIISLINVADDDGSSMGNAFWNGQAMFYGNGDGAFLPLARGLDVAGHEMSHGVIQSTANLEYEGESGALNESFADVFGVLIDRDDWKIGEDVVKTAAFPSGALRSMDDPHNGATTNDFNRGWQPRHYTERYTGTEDNGGVHINSGIPNWAFFKFATAVGKDKAEKVYYRAISNYLTKSSQFSDCRVAVVKAATDLYGTVEINAAKKAFDEVGISGETQGNYQTDVQTNPGEEFILTTNSSNSGLFLYGTNGTLLKQISSTSIISKPSVSDDGKFIVFVGSDKKLREIAVDWTKNPVTFTENIIGTTPIWRNAIISKDGLKIAATVQDTSNEIIVFYFGGTSTIQNTFELYNPTYTQGVSTGDVLYSDAMEFDVTGEFIMYDAENKLKSSTSGAINYWDIGFIKVWNNSSKTFSLGKVDKLYSSLPNDVSVGNPTFSKNSPYIISFDYLEGSDDISILGANIETGEAKLIYENNTLGFPNYSSKDNILLFDNINSGNTAYNIGSINLNANKIQPSANPFLFISSRRWATWFSNGKRTLSATTDEKSFESAEIKVINNPASDILRLELDEQLTKDTKCIIYDMSGQTILSANQGVAGNIMEIDITQLVGGMYMASILSNNTVASVKFIKQ